MIAKRRIFLYQEQNRHHITIAFSNLATTKRIAEITLPSLANTTVCHSESLGSIRPLILVKDIKTTCVVIDVKLQAIHYIIVRQCYLKTQRVARLDIRTTKCDIVGRISVCPYLDVMQSAVGVIGVKL